MPACKRTVYDAVVVGAGPAGSLLAYHLARRGKTILLIEKKQLPRYKACGGGLTRRARALIPFDIEHLVEDRAYATRLRVHYRTAFAHTADTAAVHLVMRDRLDHFLARQAVAAGAVLLEGTRFLSLEGPAGDLRLQTSHGRFQTRFIVGADGVHSRVGRALGLPLAYGVMPALEAELTLTPVERQRFAGSVYFDFGVIPGGYAWLFPKRNGVSAGILARRRASRGLRTCLMGYLARNGLSGREGLRSLRLHLIPCRPHHRNRYADPRGLVVGDATGLVDPVTGEGIFYALRSAQMAAGILTSRKHDRRTMPERYNRSIKREIEAEVLKADLLARILYRLPRLSNWILTRCGAKIGAKHMAVYRDEIGYRQLLRYAMSPRGFAYLLGPRHGGSPQT